MMRATCLLFVVVTACAGEPVDAPPLGDYTTWKRIDTYGEAPGHGDTYRVIYANDEAESYDAMVSAFYAEGTIVVKEVYDRAAGATPAPGALRIVEIARRIGPVTGEQGGWLFSDAAEPGGAETEATFCWRRCHQAAPFEGMWFDYSK